MSDTNLSNDGTGGITENITLALPVAMPNLADSTLTITVTSPTETLQVGDVLLANTMPEAEYMYGCTPTAVGMILGYYDLYGYRGADFSTLIEGDVDLKSRGTDGNAYDMDAFDTVLGRAIASTDYVYRFFSRGDLDVITGNKAGSYWTTSAEEELEYSFVNDGAGPEIRTDIWNCIADYLGTGQIWRGNDNLSTSISQSTLEDILNYNMNINYIMGDIQRLVDWRYTSMLYGLYLYVESRGYSLDREITGTYMVDVNGGDFTFEDYKAEIDAGRPVLISLEGHSMVGYGYNSETNEIIFDDCYRADQRMVWGDTYLYSDMYLPLQSITVIGLMAAGGADLAVTPVSVDSAEVFFTSNAVPFSSGGYCYPGDPVSVNFTVSNLGATDCGAFEVTVYVDGKLSKTIAVLSLEGNSSAEHTDIQLDALAPGLHTVRVVADEANEIQETSGANNVLEQKLMVLKDGANIVTGIKTVNAGQVSTNDYVASGWQMHVLDGGTASGTVVRGIVTDVAPNGVISYLPSLAVVSQGGLIQDAEVYEYAQIQLDGTAEDLHVFEKGTAMIQPGGKLTGKLTIENGAVVSMDEGTILDFNLTKTEAGTDAHVNDLSRIQGTPLYTLTVEGTEAGGTYALADGAAGFAGTISVTNAAGDDLGTLTVGNSVMISDMEYALILSESILSVAVTVPTAVTSSGLVLTDETRTVGEGETYLDTTVNSGGILYVDTDGTAEKTTVKEYGELCVFSGGSAENTTVNSGGFFIVDWEGAATGTTVDKGGEFHIALGGTASDVTVNPGGLLFVEDGGTATRIVENGGYVDYYEGEADVTFVPNTISELLLENASATIHSGTTANGVTVNSGGMLEISSGGSATATTVNQGGDIFVASGGTATRIVENGGYVFYDDDADITFVPNTINDLQLKRASATIHSGTTVNSVTVNEHGRLDVYYGGTAARIVENGGYVSVKPGADATFAPNTFSGMQLEYTSATIHSGTTANAIRGNKQGRLDIFSGGTANDITVESRSEILLSFSSGGIANDITVKDRGMLRISGSGTATDVDILAGGSLVIFRGASANGVSLDSQGWLIVSSGGTAVVVGVPGGNIITKNDADVVYQYDPGVYCLSYTSKYETAVSRIDDVVNSMSISSGINLCVCSGGTVNDATVLESGGIIVFSGGTVNNTYTDGKAYYSDYMGGIFLNDGGVANNTINAGRFYVFSGGTANGAIVSSGGSMHVSSGGTANDVTVNSGGTMFISSGATATIAFNPWQGHKAIYERGGKITYLERDANVYYGGEGKVGLISKSDVMELPALESGQSAIVYSGGMAYNAAIDAGGNLYVSSGGTANQTTVNAGGNLYVFSGGTANDITINAEGILQISSGVTANSVTVNEGGSMVVSKGGTATGISVNEGGSLTVLSGGSAVVVGTPGIGQIKEQEGAKVIYQYDPGVYYINDGKLVSSADVMNSISTASGSIIVLGDSIANGTTVESDGSMTIDGGGTANSTTVCEGGVLRIQGGTASSTTVNAGGIAILLGGTADGIRVKSGGSLQAPLGKITGQMIFEDGAQVGNDMGGRLYIDFDISYLTPEAPARINNLLVVQKARITDKIYSLVVSETQEKGVYTLADGAADFYGTISVLNQAEEKLGSFSVGETLKVGDIEYTLNLTDDVLSVTVGPIAAPEPELPSPANPVGTADKVSWEAAGAAQYIVEYSTDDFEHTIRIVTTGNGIDTPELPSGTYQWRVKADSGDEWTVGEAITVEPEADAAPKVVQSNEDGSEDLFFAAPVGVWENIYYAYHVGSVNDWTGTNEVVSANGKGRIQNLFFGSSDPNVLCLTDGENGDAIFVDDVYTDLPESIAEHTARLYKIQEIRAGAGNDIVDMTSQQFEYTGDGLTIRGGDGNDVIWASKGDNILFGDAGNDRIVGASGNDVIAGGIGDDSMHGGGGNDVFTFCDNWGSDTVEQLAAGTVTLWFASGAESNWNAETLTYTDGENSVTVSGVDADRITLKFGENTPADVAQFATISDIGAFDACTSRKIFEESGTGLLANA